MKTCIKIFPLLALLLIMTSCGSIRVAADYDKEASFDNYNTFAFFKTGIDKAEISDLDKRRILRAIETELLAKGLVKSETPDILVSLFTKSQQRVDVYNNAWGMGAWGWGGSRIIEEQTGLIIIKIKTLLKYKRTTLKVVLLYLNELTSLRIT